MAAAAAPIIFVFILVVSAVQLIDDK